MRCQPRDLVIKDQRVTALVPSPRHGDDRHAVNTPRHSGCVSFKMNLNRANARQRTHQHDYDPALQIKIDVLNESFLDTEEHSFIF